jgi:hypothetical protein
VPRLQSEKGVAHFFRTERRRSPNGGTYPWIVRSTALVNQWHLYIKDADFGPFFLKFSSYFPYNARLCLNGHEFLKAQLQQTATCFTANRRLLDVQTITQDCALGEAALRQVTAPVVVEGQRAAGLRYADPRVQALLSALLGFMLLVRGFTNQLTTDFTGQGLARRASDRFHARHHTPPSSFPRLALGVLETGRERGRRI